MGVLARFRVYGSDAQDVSQVVWLRLVEHLDDLREPRALPRWLATTAHNECLRFLRARKRTVPVDPLGNDLRDDPDHADPTEGMLRSERVEALLEALGELSERDQTMLALLVEDPPLPYREIASRMGISVGSIGPTRMRVLRKLRASPALVALYGPSPGGRGGGEHDVATLVG
jgi:RNA polymerase sigma factor (sigma-70 family)